MYSTNTVIYERDNKIPISKPTTRQMKTAKNNYDEYSLKQNFFDPSKSSPPNNFMVKLQMRIDVFNSFKNDT
jgi:hypothetical protein